MNWLIDIDQQLLLAINGWHAPWADTLMWYISASWTWIPLYLVLAGLLVWRFGWKRAFLMLVVIGCAVGLSDWFSTLLKHNICRLRPTYEPALAGMVHTVRGYTGGMYGFPSSHAANTMSVALIFSLLYQHPSPHDRRQTTSKSPWLLLLWVAANCWSRMYLGVHYPGDILVGLMVGAALAFPAYKVCLWLQRWEWVEPSCRTAADARQDAASCSSESAACEAASPTDGS